MNQHSHSKPRFSAASSTDKSLSNAIDSIATQLKNDVSTLDLAVAFVSMEYAEQFDESLAELGEKIGARNFVGITAESIVANESEHEMVPAVSVWAAELPQVSIESMHLRYEHIEDGGAITGWNDISPVAWEDCQAFFLLADPYSFPADVLLHRFNEDHSGVPVFGGNASGANQPDDARILVNSQVHTDGAAAVLVGGDIRIRSMVSQGCRPIGTPMVVTRSEQNEIFELGGLTAIEQMKKIFSELPTRDQRAFQQGLFLGRVVNEYQDKFSQGDFLIRNVMGIQPDNQSVVVADYIRPGVTVQFHIRDQETATAEMKQLLAEIREVDNRPELNRSGLLFSCNGRGSRMFDHPHHDAALIRSVLGDIPLAGCFAGGEFGPLAGQNFVHGFTASLAVVEEL